MGAKRDRPRANFLPFVGRYPEAFGIHFDQHFLIYSVTSSSSGSLTSVIGTMHIAYFKFVPSRHFLRCDCFAGLHGARAPSVVSRLGGTAC